MDWLILAVIALVVVGYLSFMCLIILRMRRAAESVEGIKSANQTIKSMYEESKTYWLQSLDERRQTNVLLRDLLKILHERRNND